MFSPFSLCISLFSTIIMPSFCKKKISDTFEVFKHFTAQISRRDWGLTSWCGWKWVIDWQEQSPGWVSAQLVHGSLHLCLQSNDVTSAEPHPCCHLLEPTDRSHHKDKILERSGQGGEELGVCDSKIRTWLSTLLIVGIKVNVSWCKQTAGELNPPKSSSPLAS